VWADLYPEWADLSAFIAAITGGMRQCDTTVDVNDVSEHRSVGVELSEPYEPNARSSTIFVGQNSPCFLLALYSPQPGGPVRGTVPSFNETMVALNLWHCERVSMRQLAEQPHLLLSYAAFALEIGDGPQATWRWLLQPAHRDDSGSVVDLLEALATIDPLRQLYPRISHSEVYFVGEKDKAPRRQLPSVRRTRDPQTGNESFEVRLGELHGDATVLCRGTIADATEVVRQYVYDTEDP
jgi:hypothetical protein